MELIKRRFAVPELEAQRVEREEKAMLTSLESSFQAAEADVRRLEARLGSAAATDSNGGTATDSNGGTATDSESDLMLCGLCDDEVEILDREVEILNIDQDLKEAKARLLEAKRRLQEFKISLDGGMGGLIIDSKGRVRRGTEVSFEHGGEGYGVLRLTKLRLQVSCLRCTLMTEASLTHGTTWLENCTRCKQELEIKAMMEIAHQFSQVVALLEVYFES